MLIWTIRNLEGSLSETWKEKGKNADYWRKDKYFAVNTVFSFSFSKNLEMEKSGKQRPSLCIPMTRLMSALQGDCPRPCSQLQSQLLSTLRQEGWTGGAKSMTAEQLKHAVSLYFPNWVKSRFSLRSKQTVIGIPRPCIDRLMHYPKAVHVGLQRTTQLSEKKKSWIFKKYLTHSAKDLLIPLYSGELYILFNMRILLLGCHDLQIFFSFSPIHFHWHK